MSSCHFKLFVTRIDWYHIHIFEQFQSQTFIIISSYLSVIWAVNVFESSSCNNKK